MCVTNSGAGTVYQVLYTILCLISARYCKGIYKLSEPPPSENYELWPTTNQSSWTKSITGIMTVFAGISPAYSDRCTKVNHILRNLNCIAMHCNRRQRKTSIDPWPKVQQRTWSLFMFTGSSPYIVHSQRKIFLDPWPKVQFTWSMFIVITSHPIYTHSTPCIIHYTKKDLSWALTQGTRCTYAMVCLRWICWMSCDRGAEKDLYWPLTQGTRCTFAMVCVCAQSFEWVAE